MSISSSLKVSASMISARADVLDFGLALRNTKNPVMQARAVATYRRLVQRSAQIEGTTLNDAEKELLLGAAQIEVASRAYDRKVAADLRKQRLEALKEMREELEFSK